MSRTAETQRTPDVAAGHVRGVADLLRTGGFGVLLGGTFLSAVGKWIHVAVTSWLLYEITGSSAMVGLLVVAQFVPIVTFTLPAGLLADHRDRRSYLLWVQTAMMVLAVAFAVLVWSGVVTPVVLIGFTAALGVGGAFVGPAWLSYVSDIVPPERALVGFSLNSVAFHLAATLGPPIGAIILGLADAATAFAINAVSYLAVIGALMLTRPRMVVPEPFPGFRRATVELYRFARVSQRAKRLLPTCAAIALVAFGLPAILPAYAATVLAGNAGAYGKLMGAVGAGSLTGALTMGYLSIRVARRTIIIAGAWSVAAGVVLLAAAGGGLPLAMAGCVGLGAGQLMLLVTSRTVIQMDAPASLRARVVGLWFLCAVGLGPVGGVGLGWLADALGVQTTVSLVAGYAVFVAAFLWVAARTAAGRIVPYQETQTV